MTQDPDYDGTGTPVTSVSIPWPPRSGPGSDKEAWAAFAQEVALGRAEAQEVLDELSALIASLEAEVAELRAKLAECAPAKAQPDTLRPSTLGSDDGELTDDKPRDTRRKMSEATKAAIRAGLAAGLSQSEAARRNGVSAMTVSRLVRSA